MNTIALCFAILSCQVIGYGSGYDTQLERRDAVDTHPYYAIDSLVPGYREKRADPVQTGGGVGTPPPDAGTAEDTTQGPPGGFALWDSVATGIATPFAFIVKLIALLLRSIVQGIGSLFGGGGGGSASAGLDQAIKGIGTTLNSTVSAAQGALSQPAANATKPAAKTSG